MDANRLRIYAELDQRRLALRKEIDALEDQLRPLEEQIIEEIAQEGVSKLSVGTKEFGIVTVYLDRRVWAKCVNEDWDRACEALKEAGLGEYVQKRYNTTSFSAYLRELDRANEPLPEALVGAVEADVRMSIRTRRS